MDTQKTPADRLRELADSIEAVTSENYCAATASGLFDGSDVDTLRAVAAELDGRAAAQIHALQRRLGHALSLAAAGRGLAIDANRLADRNLGGTYEDDVRRSLKSFNAIYRRFKDAAHLTQETDANVGDEKVDRCESCNAVTADGDVHTTDDDVDLCGACFRGIFGNGGN
jgi:hypothetical protein